MIRKLIHQYFMKLMCEKNRVYVQHIEVTQMIRDFLLDSENHMSHLKRYSNNITNSLGPSSRFFLLAAIFVQRGRL